MKKKHSFFTLCHKPILLALVALSSFLSGCAVSTSGNLLGEAAATKYSTDEKKVSFC